MEDVENSAIGANTCYSSGAKSTLTTSTSTSTCIHTKPVDAQKMQVDESFSSADSRIETPSLDLSVSSAGTGTSRTRISACTTSSTGSPTTNIDIHIDIHIDTSLEDDDEKDKEESPKRKSVDDLPGLQRKKKAFVTTSSSEDGKMPSGQLRKPSVLYSSSEDESDSALHRALATLLSPTRNISQEEDSDSSMETPPPRLSRKKAASAASKAMKRLESTATPSPIPTDKDKEVILEDIDNEKDRNLQRLVWSIGCRYTLLSYQFLGVRSLAGVPVDYPGMQSKEHYTMDQWQKVLRETKLAEQAGRKKRRGLLMADVMGLGKTVQAVVACMLRNAIAKAQGLDKKPTLIVSPNHAVTAQWADTLVKAGVPPNHIFEFIPRKGNPKPQTWHRSNDTYLLLNRYQLQTETKYLFKELPKDFNSRARTDRDYKSPLYPTAQKQLLCILKNQYLSAHGLQKNRSKHKNETASECVTRLLTSFGNCNKVFRTLVIDEAHFLKNLLAYWGLGTALLSLHTERVIPMTGTPYNNSAQDIATLMTFVDPSLDSASEDWWKRATQHGAPAAVATAVLNWNESYMLRREKKVLGNKLKKKEIVCKSVAPIPLELAVYERFESNFLSILDKFSKISDDHSPSAMRRKKELFKHMVALAACMRMALIHPVMPGGGRDLTINYSPTRHHLSRSLCNPHRCVLCKYRPETKFEGKQRSPSTTRRDDRLENLGDDLLMDDDFSLADDQIDDDNGELVEVPSKYCTLPNIKEGGLRHFVHEDCLDDVMVEGCPLCADLCSRAEMATGKLELIDSIKNAAPRVHPQVDTKLDPSGSQKPDIIGLSKPRPNLFNLNMTARPVYCADVTDGLGGFRSSAKIESIISDLRASLLADDKVLMLSFFKASLDLLEGILHYELNVDYARFDGDFTGEERQKQLDRFKQEKNCKVLLMTVQTGGTGLNIVEANTCVFIDRWFNPFVHEQAEDRIYRLGQNRDVTVTYHDVSYTIDMSMRVLNDIKTTNASIVLADGQTTLNMASSGLSYKEMNGLLGNSVREVKVARIANLVGRSREMLEAPMVAPPDFCDRLSGAGETVVDKDGGFISKRPQAAFSSIGDALLHILGYARNPNETQTQTLPSKTRLEASRMKPASGTLPDNTSSLNGSDNTSGDEVLKESAVSKGVVKPTLLPACIISNSFPSDPPSKAQALPNKAESLENAPPKSFGFNSHMLDFSSDDDSLSSIPDRVFKK